MKIGDLVAIGAGFRHGVVVEDHTMTCSHGVRDQGTPYRMGGMMVLVEGKVERVVYANLRMANEDR